MNAEKPNRPFSLLALLLMVGTGAVGVLPQASAIYCSPQLQETCDEALECAEDIENCRLNPCDDEQDPCGYEICQQPISLDPLAVCDRVIGGDVHFCPEGEIGILVGEDDRERGVCVPAGGSCNDACNELLETASLACDPTTGVCVSAAGVGSCMGLTSEQMDLNQCTATAYCNANNSWHLEGELWGAGRFQITLRIDCGGAMGLDSCVLNYEDRHCLGVEVTGNGQLGCYYSIDYGSENMTVEKEWDGKCVDPLNPDAFVPAVLLPSELR